MKAIRKKAIITGIMTCVLVISMSLQAWAAGSVSITANKSKVSIGDEVTVTVEAKEPSGAAERPQISIQYDAAKLTFVSCNKSYGGGGGGLITLTDTSATIKFKAAETGTTQVSVAAILDGDGANIPTNTADIDIGSSSGDGAAEGNQLETLSLSDGTLSPEFLPEITSYTLVVPNSVTKVVISGKPAEAAAITAVTGFEKLEVGDNEASIIVKAKNGATLEYQFKITRSETEDSDVQGIADGNIPLSTSNLMVSPTFPDEIMPKGFQKAEYSYKGQLVESAKLDMGDLLLLYVIGEDSSAGDFYIYNEATDEFADFVQINGIEGRFIIILQPEEDVEVPAGLTKATLQWGAKTLSAWMLAEDQESSKEIGGVQHAAKGNILAGIYAGAAKTMTVYAGEALTEEQAEQEAATPDDAQAEPEDTAPDAQAEPEDTTTDAQATPEGSVVAPEYFFLYAISSEGNKGWYSYDSVEGTYQRYFDRAISSSGDDLAEVGTVVDFKEQSQRRFLIICVMSAIILILCIAVIHLILKLREYRFDDFGGNDIGDAEESYEEDEPIDEIEKMRRRVIAKEGKTIKKSRENLNFMKDKDSKEMDDGLETFPTSSKKARQIRSIVSEDLYESISNEPKKKLKEPKIAKVIEPDAEENSSKIKAKKAADKTQKTEDQLKTGNKEKSLALDDDFEFEFLDLD